MEKLFSPVLYYHKCNNKIMAVKKNRLYIKLHLCEINIQTADNTMSKIQNLYYSSANLSNFYLHHSALYLHKGILLMI